MSTFEEFDERLEKVAIWADMCDMRHMSTSLKIVAALSLVAEAIGAAALVWPRPR